MRRRAWDAVQRGRPDAGTGTDGCAIGAQAAIQAELWVDLAGGRTGGRETVQATVKAAARRLWARTRGSSARTLTRVQAGWALSRRDGGYRLLETGCAAHGRGAVWRTAGESEGGGVERVAADSEGERGGWVSGGVVVVGSSRVGMWWAAV